MQDPVRCPAPKIPWPKHKQLEQDFQHEHANDRQGDVAEQFHIPDFFLGLVEVEKRGADLQHDKDDVDKGQEQNGDVGAFAFDGFAESVAEAADAGLASVGAAAVLVEVLATKWV